MDPAGPQREILEQGIRLGRSVHAAVAEGVADDDHAALLGLRQVGVIHRVDARLPHLHLDDAVGVFRQRVPVVHMHPHRDVKLYMTPLFLVLLVVESTDVAFAVDSVPAILGVFKDRLLQLLLRRPGGRGGDRQRSAG